MYTVNVYKFEHTLARAQRAYADDNESEEEPVRPRFDRLSKLVRARWIRMNAHECTMAAELCELTDWQIKALIA